MEKSLTSAEKLEEHPKMTLKLEETAYNRRHSLPDQKKKPGR